MTAGTGTGGQYAALMTELWDGVHGTLGRVDALAEEPDELATDRGVEALRRLQYRLHLAAERAYGIAPPPHSASAHADLRTALLAARDATAAVAATIEDEGPDDALPLLHEWRGALFRVRLARLRLAAPDEGRDGRPGDTPGIAAPLAAFLLALVGAGAFVAGATIGLWPLWAVGLAAVGAAVLAYRP